MKLTKEVRALVRGYISDRPNINVNDLAELIKVYADRPDVAALLEQEYRRTARRFITACRDGEGTRTVLALDDGRGEFVNVEKSDSLPDLDKVASQLTIKLAGIQKTMKKVKQRRAIVTGQISMVEALAEPLAHYRKVSQ